MLETPPLLIRADAGGHLGTGHVMRMIALAQAWQDRGGTVTLAACQCPPALIQRIESEDISFVSLGDHSLGGEAELAATAGFAKELSAKWVVLDGYQFREDFQKTLKENGLKVLAVDDYGHCQTWYADLVLNQNVYGREFPYPCAHGGTNFLKGPQFALLRREFLGRELDRTDARPPLNKLLLSCGGVDPDNVTGKIITALNTLRQRSLSLRILVGAGNPHREKLRCLASASTHEIEFLQDVTDMPAQYEWADGIVGAGGTTCLEWLLFSLPAALVRVADNQNLVVATLAAKDRCFDLGWHESLQSGHTADQLADWLDNGAATTNFSAFHVDSWGAGRVAAHLDNGLRLRKATADDCELYFRWANDPLVRQNAINTTEISWEDHCRWFSSRIESPRVRFFLCFDQADEPVGQVRFELKSQPYWEIDFSVAPPKRGNRIGYEMMSLALRSFRAVEKDPVLALIKRSNSASWKIFENLGFTTDKDTGNELIRMKA